MCYHNTRNDLIKIRKIKEFNNKEVTKKLMDLIVTLRDYVPQVNVYGVRGNHDRMIANFKEHVVEESFFD